MQIEDSCHAASASLGIRKPMTLGRSVVEVVGRRCGFYGLLGNLNQTVPKAENKMLFARRASSSRSRL